MEEQIKQKDETVQADPSGASVQADQPSQTNEMPSWAQRSFEILNVFADHNFYVNGFTPYELRTTLEDLGPTYVKIGQIMSSRTDMLPKAYCEELERLRSSVAPSTQRRRAP